MRVGADRGHYPELPGQFLQLFLEIGAPWPEDRLGGPSCRWQVAATFLESRPQGW
jgi:hypothetical protein